jgi:hypothetical protein
MNISGGAMQVAVGSVLACAIVNASVKCWGFGQHGDDSSPFAPALVPTQVSGLGGPITAITVGAYSACAIVNGEAECWGRNTTGQLGNGGAIDEFAPMAVTGFP